MVNGPTRVPDRVVGQMTGDMRTEKLPTRRSGRAQHGSNGRSEQSALATKSNSELDLGAVSNTHLAQGLIIKLRERADCSPDFAFVFPMSPQRGRA